MMKFLILLFISTPLYAIPRFAWKGEVTGLQKTSRKNVFEIKTKSKDIQVVLDCASPTKNLALIEENINNSIALETSECKKIYTRLQNWAKTDKEYTLGIDSLSESVVSKK